MGMWMARGGGGGGGGRGMGKRCPKKEGKRVDKPEHGPETNGTLVSEASGTDRRAELSASATAAAAEPFADFPVGAGAAAKSDGLRRSCVAFGSVTRSANL